MKKKFALLGFVMIILMPLMSSVFWHSSAQEPQTAVQLPKGNRLTITVPKYMVDRDKWVFMFAAGDDGQFCVVDSLYLKKDETTFAFENIKLETNIDFIDIMPEGVMNFIALMKCDEMFDLYYSVDDIGIETLTGIGGRTNYRRIEQSNKRRTDYLRNQDTIAKLRKEKIPFDRLQQIQDSLENEENRYLEECVLEEVNSEYDEIAIVAWMILKNHFNYSKHKTDSLWAMLSKRFPENNNIRWSLGTYEFPPYTEETKRISAKRRELFGIGQKSERPKVEPYKIGDVVSGLAIKNKDGKLISLDSIKTKFVLIDFWAQWCLPCRKEIPYLIQAQDEFSDKFTVYAVSIDKIQQNWFNAIRDDHSDMLTHVLLGDGTAEANLVLAKFDVKSLPKNFLLDDQRKIIAIDLRGDELLDVIREFCK